MAFQVQQAVKKATKIRMSIAGPSGSGKTIGALRVAFGLCGDWSKIVVIDTNIDDALLYAGDKVEGIGQFGHIPFPNPHGPRRFIEAIDAALAYGAEVVVIDSASDEWAGIGGMLELHDQVKGFNTAANWAKVNPAHQDFIKAMVEQKKAHIIATFRQKSKVAIDEVEENGRKTSTVRRLGMENIARPGTEYDFLLAVELDRDTHKADIITKRGSMLPDMRPVELTVKLGANLKAWAETGSEDEKIETRDDKPITTTPPTNGNGKPPAGMGQVQPAQPLDLGDKVVMPDEPKADPVYASGATYTGSLAKIGKTKYPQDWAKTFATFSRCNPYELDGILQKLALPQNTPTGEVVTRVNAYLDEKAETEGGTLALDGTPLGGE